MSVCKRLTVNIHLFSKCCTNPLKLKGAQWEHGMCHTLYYMNPNTLQTDIRKTTPFDPNRPDWLWVHQHYSVCLCAEDPEEGYIYISRTIHLTSSHLIFAHLISSQFISAHLISNHLSLSLLISSHLISVHLSSSALLC